MHSQSLVRQLVHRESLGKVIREERDMRDIGASIEMPDGFSALAVGKLRIAKFYKY